MIISEYRDVCRRLNVEFDEEFFTADNDDVFMRIKYDLVMKYGTRQFKCYRGTVPYLFVITPSGILEIISYNGRITTYLAGSPYTTHALDYSSFDTLSSEISELLQI